MNLFDTKHDSGVRHTRSGRLKRCCDCWWYQQVFRLYIDVLLFHEDCYHSGELEDGMSIYQCNICGSCHFNTAISQNSYVEEYETLYFICSKCATVVHAMKIGPFIHNVYSFRIMQVFRHYSFWYAMEMGRRKGIVSDYLRGPYRVEFKRELVSRYHV